MGRDRLRYRFVGNLQILLSKQDKQCNYTIMQSNVRMYAMILLEMGHTLRFVQWSSVGRDVSPLRAS